MINAHAKVVNVTTEVYRDTLRLGVVTMMAKVRSCAWFVKLTKLALDWMALRRRKSSRELEHVLGLKPRRLNIQSGAWKCLR
ncbi:MAG: hypothetical protein ACTS6P_01155 [Candidatus Hodgkinia cicadicola]